MALVILGNKRTPAKLMCMYGTSGAQIEIDAKMKSHDVKKQACEAARWTDGQMLAALREIRRRPWLRGWDLVMSRQFANHYGQCSFYERPDRVFPTNTYIPSG